MDWFEALTGFKESAYAETQQRLKVDDGCLVSLATGRRFGMGRFEMVSLAALRRRAAGQPPADVANSFCVVQGDVRELHGSMSYEGALFQVASQFNMLEMVSERVSPEDGVTRYAGDPTQGPACAMAAGAATIYRNYLVPVAGGTGQTRDRQLDGSEQLREALAAGMGLAPDTLWTMRNGYAMFQPEGLARIVAHLRGLNDEALDRLRATLAIGLHWGVEVTGSQAARRRVVSQAFCSALPVSYNNIRNMQGADWAPLASLVLEAAYEATLWAAVTNAQSGAVKKVLLTLLGGGAFGNDRAWILAAMRRAIGLVANRSLEIVVVSYGAPAPDLEQMISDLR